LFQVQFACFKFCEVLQVPIATLPPSFSLLCEMSTFTLRDKIDNNRAMQEVVIEGLQLDLIRTIKVQDINIEGLQSIMVRIEKVQKTNMEGLNSDLIKTTKVEHIKHKRFAIKYG
jgi:DNA-binding Xre family transcriptional regulator